MAAKKSAKIATAKKSVAKASAKAPAKKSPALSVKEPFSKSQTIAHIAELSGVKKREVAAIFETLSQLISGHLNKKGPGEFNMPGLFKCRVIRKPATKPRKGINPFTGEPTVFKAKPARNVVKIRPLKKLKEMAE